MDNKYLLNVIAEMKPFFDENGFVCESEGVYKTDAKKIEVSYNDARQMFVLKVAEIEVDDFGEPVELSAWLFDDSQNEKDAESVGMDFVDTLRKNMGIKAKKVGGINVDLPTVSKDGALNVSGFAKKALDVYPQLKDLYKEHIEQYGNFLYMNFFADNLVPAFVESLAADSKRAKKKIYDLCNNAYLKGDKETVNIVVACLAAACCKGEKAEIMDMLEQNPHMKSSVLAFIPMLSSKKMKAIFLK